MKYKIELEPKDDGIEDAKGWSATLHADGQRVASASGLTLAKTLKNLETAGTEALNEVLRLTADMEESRINSLLSSIGKAQRKLSIILYFMRFGEWPANNP